MEKQILVTGGAGYIGSHTIIELIKEGYYPVVIDNLSTGHKKAVLGGTFYEMDLSDTKTLTDILKKHNISAVLHFSAHCYVGESVVNPHKYFKNNVSNTLSLLEAMLEANVKNIILSSTAATYGNPTKVPIDETHPQNPCNPYGLSMLFMEQIIQTYEKAYGIKHMYLRYFNAAGSDPENRIGEDHYPETHIIPLLIQTAMGVKKQFTVLGTDYDTYDGTCIRDYVHVSDIARAHVMALKLLEEERKSNIFNLGSSVGYSVLEIISKVKKITGRDIPVELSNRREGDPSILVSSSEKAKTVLGWEPQYTIEDSIQTTWDWRKQYPKGFKNVT
jgi:UDP-glucose 4-epimerase